MSNTYLGGDNRTWGYWSTEVGWGVDSAMLHKRSALDRAAVFSTSTLAGCNFEPCNNICCWKIQKCSLLLYSLSNRIFGRTLKRFFKSINAERELTTRRCFVIADIISRQAGKLQFFSLVCGELLIWRVDLILRIPEAGYTCQQPSNNPLGLCEFVQYTLRASLFEQVVSVGSSCTLSMNKGPQWIEQTAPVLSRS